MRATRTERRQAWLHQLLHTGNPGDLEFYLGACRGARRVAELGCGSGRILAALARRGHDVVGIELHRGMISLARERLERLERLEQHDATLRRRVRLVHADMRAPGELGVFDRVLIPYNGLLCLTEPTDVRACLAWVARSLAPGGLLVFDVYEPPERELADAADDEELSGEERPIVAIEEDGLSIVVLESDTWRPREQRVDAAYRYEIDGDEGRYEVRDTIPQRYLYPDQIRAHLEEAGLRVDALERRAFGEAEDAAAEPDEHPPQIVVRARRAEARGEDAS